MAFSKTENVKISGVSACVPNQVVENSDYPFFSRAEYEKFIASVGIERRRMVVSGTCTSDLCFIAAGKLLDQLGWERSTVDLLIFVSHTADYTLPATSCILQDRLNLSTDCMTLDIPLGCSGYTHGLMVASSLLSKGHMKRALLLVGNTQSSYASFEDKSVYPLFADAGTATALEYSPTVNNMVFHFGTDGSGFDAIIVPDGGCRNPVNERSFDLVDYEGGIRRSRLHEKLDGMEVFSFGINRAPETVRRLLSLAEKKTDEIDYFVFHQANKFMIERIRKKLSIPIEKVPFNIKDYGNTSGASIPLLMVTNLQHKLKHEALSMVLCGFGVGLSWGSALVHTEEIICPDLIEI